jgi:antagonist of KipI
VNGAVLEVLIPGPLTTVQDLGRAGYERYGVPPSGAMDWFALWAANRLVGNPPGAAGLEFSLGGPDLRAGSDCLVAAAGVGYDLFIQGRRVGLWRAALVWAGEVIHLEPLPGAGWGCLAIAGGIDLPPVMGSRSTYLRGGFGGLDGRALQPGDRLPGGGLPAGAKRRAGRRLAAAYRPAYAAQVSLPVVLGPQLEVFGEAGAETLLGGEFAVSPTSDRMGYRLAGPGITHLGSPDLLSEGIAPGSVQVPADGQPIVLMSDRPTAGGYPKIATLARVGLPLLAQAMPGVGKVRFAAVSVAEAQARLRNLVDGIEKGLGGDADGSEL